MRKAVLLFSAFLFFCTSLLLGCVITLKQIKEQGMSELVISHVNLEAPLREALERIPGGFLVEKPIMQQLDTLQENLMKRKDWTQFLDTAGMAFLQSVAQPDAQLPDLNRQFSELLSTDKDTLFQNTSLSDTEQALLLQVLTKQLNLNSRLQTLAKETRASLTPSAILGIRFLYSGLQEYAVRYVCGAMLLSIVVLLLSAGSVSRTLRIAAVILLMSGILLLLAGYGLPSLGSSPYLQVGEILEQGCQRLRTLSVRYVESFGILFILSILFKKICKAER